MRTERGGGMARLRALVVLLGVLAAPPAALAQQQAQQGPHFDMGQLANYFQPVGPAQVGPYEYVGVGGQVSHPNAIKFLAQATRRFEYLSFVAYFYDADGIQIYFIPVKLDPDLVQWQPGSRTWVVVLLPDPPVLSRVRLIRLVEF